jgi:mono/diheme cytochrome c family protein
MAHDLLLTAGRAVAIYLLMRHCHQCHPRGGDGGLRPALNNKPVPGFLVKCQVRLGLGAMPFS